MKLWSFQLRGKVYPVALATRDDVREWAADRFMSSAMRQHICSKHYDRHSRRMHWWERVKRNHPSAKIVRVKVEPVK